MRLRNFLILAPSLLLSVPLNYFLWQRYQETLVVKIYFSAICYIFLLFAFFIVLLALFFVVPKIFTLLLKISRKKPGAFSLGLAFCCIYLASKSAERLCEALYKKFAAPLERIPLGLSPDSPVELIVRGNHPLQLPGEDRGESEDAMIIVHGAQQSPRRMQKIYSYPAFTKGFDLYVPLLLYHRRTLEKMNEINYHQMSRQLLEDIKYVESRTKGKIYCIGHSMGAGLLCYLSLRGDLPPRVKLVLYAPAIQTQVGPVIEIATWIASFFNRYRVLPDVFGTRGFKSGHNFPEFITTQKLITVLCTSARELKRMLEVKQMQNNFVCILCRKDPRILSLKVAELLKKQKKLAGLTWIETHHSPHLEEESVESICEAIQDAIQTLDNDGAQAETKVIAVEEDKVFSDFEQNLASI